MPAVPNDPHQSAALVTSVLDQLACPACHGGLRIEEKDLVCVLCGRNFPIVDGIPVLIAEPTDQKTL
jgi:hypothetical protein